MSCKKCKKNNIGLIRYNQEFYCYRCFDKLNIDEYWVGDYIKTLKILEK